MYHNLIIMCHAIWGPVPAQRAAKRPRKSASRKTASRGGTSTNAKRVTKRFRIEPERAQIVERIAKKENKTESEVLREGIDLLQRVRARKEHVPALLDYVKDFEPPKEKFRLK